VVFLAKSEKTIALGLIQKSDSENFQIQLLSRSYSRNEKHDQVTKAHVDDFSQKQKSAVLENFYPQNDDQTDHQNEIFQTGNFSRQPIVISQLKFKRTIEAQQNKFEGDSVLEILIDESGKVVEAILKNELPYGLNENSLQIARQITFSPAQVAGKNIKSKIIFRIKYRNEN